MTTVQYHSVLLIRLLISFLHTIFISKYPAWLTMLQCVNICHHISVRLTWTELPITCILSGLIKEKPPIDLRIVILGSYAIEVIYFDHFLHLFRWLLVGGCCHDYAFIASTMRAACRYPQSMFQLKLTVTSTSQLMVHVNFIHMSAQDWYTWLVIKRWMHDASFLWQ